jgi:hypothetical protein
MQAVAKQIFGGAFSKSFLTFSANMGVPVKPIN